MNNFCISCGVNKIFVKKKSLCEYCYNKIKDETKDKKEYIKKYNNERNKIEKRKVSNRLYSKKYRETHKEKYKAHKSLSKALYKKEILKRNCFVCGDINSVAHHFDYSKPLNVIWLCKNHHRIYHIIKKEEDRRKSINN